MNNIDEIEIRLAYDKDFERIYQIWFDGLDNSFDRSLIEEETLIVKFRINFNNRIGIFNFWVAIKDDEILGWQSLMKTTNNPFKENLFAESSTYVDKNCRYKGIGQLLIDYVMKEAEKSQLEYVIGYVSVSNDAARKITSETGWVELGEMPASLKPQKNIPKLFLVRPV